MTKATKTPSVVQQAADKMRQEGKKVLTLIIKQKPLYDILAGVKKKEYREVKDTTYRKLVQVDKSGENILLDENEHAIPVHYDALLLFAGYSPDRDSALVEVVGAEEEYFKDEDGNVISFEEDDGSTFYPSQIAYALGRVLAKDIHPKK